MEKRGEEKPTTCLSELPQQAADIYMALSEVSQTESTSDSRKGRNWRVGSLQVR